MSGGRDFLVTIITPVRTNTLTLYGSSKREILLLLANNLGETLAEESISITIKEGE